MHVKINTIVWPNDQDTALIVDRGALYNLTAWPEWPLESSAPFDLLIVRGSARQMISDLPDQLNELSRAHAVLAQSLTHRLMPVFGYSVLPLATVGVFMASTGGLYGGYYGNHAQQWGIWALAAAIVATLAWITTLAATRGRYYEREMAADRVHETVAKLDGQSPEAIATSRGHDRPPRGLAAQISHGMREAMAADPEAGAVALARLSECARQSTRVQREEEVQWIMLHAAPWPIPAAR